MPIIRDATADDAPDIANVITRAFAVEQQWIVEPPSSQAEVVAMMAGRDCLARCDDDGRLVGCVFLDRIADGRGRAFQLAVEPELHGRGHGSVLMLAVEQRAREIGCKRILVSVLSVRHDLFDFYDRRGYRLTGEARPLSPQIVQLVPCHLALLDKPLA